MASSTHVAGQFVTANKIAKNAAEFQAQTRFRFFTFIPMRVHQFSSNQHGMSQARSRKAGISMGNTFSGNTNLRGSSHLTIMSSKVLGVRDEYAIGKLSVVTPARQRTRVMLRTAESLPAYINIA